MRYQLIRYHNQIISALQVRSDAPMDGDEVQLHEQFDSHKIIKKNYVIKVNYFLGGNRWRGTR